jgi:hypothetical protein
MKNKNKKMKKILGEVVFVCKNFKYFDKTGVGKDQMIKTIQVFKLPKDNAPVLIASVFKHPCKEVCVYIPDGISLTLETMEKHIIPIMKDYGKYKVEKPLKD